MVGLVVSVPVGNQINLNTSLWILQDCSSFSPAGGCPAEGPAGAAAAALSLLPAPSGVQAQPPSAQVPTVQPSNYSLFKQTITLRVRIQHRFRELAREMSHIEFAKINVFLA